MPENIIVYETEDTYDCEDCGLSSETAYKFTYKGKTYGGDAVAHCFGGYDNTMEELLLELLADMGVTFELHCGEEESVEEYAAEPSDDFDIDSFGAILDGEDLGDVDMSTYDQSENKNSECEGGGCTI